MANHRLARVHVTVTKDGVRRTSRELLRLVMIEEGAVLIWHFVVPLALLALTWVGLEAAFPYPGHEGSAPQVQGYRVVPMNDSEYRLVPVRTKTGER